MNKVCTRSASRSHVGLNSESTSSIADEFKTGSNATVSNLVKIVCGYGEDAEYVSGPGKSRALMAAKRMEAGLWLCGTDNKVATAVQSHQFPDDIYSRRWTLLYQTPDL